eukprot:1160084-Pelagomonas_calceolata.AAC.9
MTKLTHYEVHNRLCILSIDDDAVNLLVIEQLLAQEGWRVGLGMGSNLRLSAEKDTHFRTQGASGTVLTAITRCLRAHMPTAWLCFCCGAAPT